MQYRKIGFLLGSLSGGGAERVTLELAEAFASKGHSVHLFLLKNTFDFQPSPNIHTHIQPEQLASKSQKQQALYQLINAEQTDQAFDLFINSKFEYAKTIPVVNRYSVIHNTYSSLIINKGLFAHRERKKYRKLRNALYNENIIAVSNGIKQDLIETIGVRPRSIQVINNPFNFDAIKAQTHDAFTGLNAPYIIYVANLIDRKRHDVLLKAFARLQDTQLQLVLLGKGKHEEQVRELAVQLGIMERTHFLGWRTDAYQWIKNAQLSVLSSDTEGLPNVLVESCILDTPIVSTDCRSGPSEILFGEMSKYLVPCGNPYAMAQTMERALSEQHRVPTSHFERFSHDRVLNQYLALTEVAAEAHIPHETNAITKLAINAT